nr:UDP-2,4-diacetamido-2,4,6-trideoxy-beta-L-altropyranose hydrolase [Methylotenera sp.]
MNIFLRVDASIHIGTGHVMRCLTLADKLKGQGATTAFICRHITEPLKQLICENGHTLVFLPQHDPALISEDSLLAHAKWIGVPQSIDAKDTLLAIGETTCDFLIVDHYALDIRWESALRQSAKKIMVIDDIADRQHDCDVLLDQNYYFDMQDRYLNLISVNTQKLLGPKYALLNQAFIDSSQNICHKTGLVKRVLVFFGGIDKDNYTQLVLEALVKLALPNIKVDVIIG